MTNKFYLLPEYPLGQSKRYTFPYPQHKGNEGPISFLDSLDGYQFGLSYHLFETTHCKSYWYVNGTGTRFQLSDMFWFWKKCFAKVIDDNGKECEQKVDEGYMNV